MPETSRDVLVNQQGKIKMEFNMRETQPISVEELKRKLESVGLYFDEVECGIEGQICLVFDTDDEEYN